MYICINNKEINKNKMTNYALNIAKGKENLNLDTFTEMLNSKVDQAYHLMSKGYGEEMATRLIKAMMQGNEEVTKEIIQKAKNRIAEGK